MSRFSPPRRARALTVLLLALAGVTLGVAAPAQASHLKGASLTAKIDGSGQLTGTVSLIARNGAGNCSAPNKELGTVTYKPPGGSDQSISIPSGDQVISACTPGSVTTTGTFSVSVAGQADGIFEVKMLSSARVSGIQNSAPSAITVIGKVKKDAGLTHKTPAITSQPALGISKLAAYSQQLATTTESGNAPTFTLLQSTDNTQTSTYDTTAPATNLVDVTSSGLVSIPFATTSGLTVGHYYVYKVRITDDLGQSTERDLLLTVSNNAPPVFDASSSTGVVEIYPDTPTTLNFTATDPDAGQTLTMAVGGVPTWGSSTTGNGTATVSLNAPASAVGQSAQIAVDATDSDTTAPMTSARTVTVRVIAKPSESTPTPTPTTPAPPKATPAAPKLGAAPPSVTTSRDAELTWTGEAGGSYTCIVNNGTPKPCSSPLKLSGLTPGLNKVRIYQTNEAGAGAVLEVTWTVTNPRVDVDAKLNLEPGDSEMAVGCVVSGVTLTKCVVDIYANLNGAAARVKIGTGTYVSKKGTRNAKLKLKLNATGRKLVQRLGGVKVSLDMTAYPKGGGAALRASGASRLLPAQVKIAPQTGIFTDQSAELTAAARAWVAATAKNLSGVRSVRCTGHTARSGTGSAEANRSLGLARAKAICRALKAKGVKAKMSSVTAGQTQPRANNRTAKGRAMNRRVELMVRYAR